MTNETERISTDQPERDDLAVGAAEALANLRATGAISVLTEFLRSSAWERVDLVFGEKRERVANALFSIAGTTAETVLREQMGEDWWQRKVSTQSLKRLPRELLPSQR